MRLPNLEVAHEAAETLAYDADAAMAAFKDPSPTVAKAWPQNLGWVDFQFPTWMTFNRLVAHFSTMEAQDPSDDPP